MCLWLSVRDIDMRFLRAGAGHFARKDGTPYPPK
jgi:hypothetical protein